MKSADLKPCPFCGAPAETDEHIERTGQNRHRYAISCSVCVAKMEVVHYGASHSDLVCMNRKRMHERWNNRT